MKLTHESSTFKFHDDKGNKYEVIVKGKHLDLHSQVFKNGKAIVTLLSESGHSNKTSAERCIKYALSQQWRKSTGT